MVCVVQLCLLLIFVVVSLSTTTTNADGCSRNWLQHVDVLNKEEGYLSEIFQANVLDMKNDTAIMVLNAWIPVLCEGAIRDLPLLEKLQLSNNGIQTLERGSFRNVPRLQELYLRYNRIKSIPKGVFNNLNLKLIDLEGNGIMHIATEAFDNITSLYSIDLSKNKLRKINRFWFLNCPNLQRISFEQNLLTKIPKEAFVNLKSQKETDISLSWNRISIVKHEAFANFQEYGYGVFDLSGNLIRNIPYDLFGLEAKQGRFELLLNHNKIACLSTRIYESVFTLCREVNLENNPITCACSTVLQDFHKNYTSNVNILFNEDVSCNSV